MTGYRNVMQQPDNPERRDAGRGAGRPGRRCGGADGAGHWLRIPLGKLRNDRYVPLHPELVKLLAAWTAASLEHIRCHKRLVADHRGTLDRHIIARIVHRVGRAAGVPGVHPHRLFVEGVPTAATANDITLLQLTGGENDSKSRQLGRFVADVAPFNLTSVNIRTIWRRDRYLRASDHVSFESLGYPAARFTEPRENFDHEHQNVQVVNGVQFGDLIEFVDFDYVARVAAVNAATVWALATAPGTPKGLQNHTTPPGTLSGTNLTTLTWNANPESNLAKYEVVMRETTAADWTDTIDVGNVTTVTLDISKDNVQFGLRAVDTAGNRSPVAFPAVAA